MPTKPRNTPAGSNGHKVVDPRTKSIRETGLPYRASDSQAYDLLSLVSHELRTSLQSVQGHTYALLRHWRDLSPDEQCAYLLTLDQSVGRLQRLMANVLDLAGLENGRLRLYKREVNLRELVQLSVEDAMGRHPAHRLQFFAESDEFYLAVDPIRIGQMMDNLLDNAAKYSSAGSGIVVRLSRSATDALVEVEDQGIGLTAEELTHIFERFYRGGRAEQGPATGLGLGLAICRGIVGAHGGRIWAKSPGPGQGATFSFTLPLE